VISFILFCAIVKTSAYVGAGVPKADHVPLPGADVGEPLFLTPLIEANKLDEARQAARVGPLPNTPDVESYAGYLTVNKEYNSNLFFWFFPNANKSAPILLWLQGGPGGSSLFGLFNENGPFVVHADGKGADLRDIAWSKDYSIFYIDNPVGTGYSFTENEKGYSNNEVDVAANLFEGLQQFFTLFSDQAHNQFYVSGESYAGKYVPAISYKIYQEGSAAKFNLTGLIIGDGLIDPESQSRYAELLYQVGMLDENEALEFYAQQNQAVDLIQKKDFLGAFKIFDELLNGDLTGFPSYFTNVTGSTNYFNFLLTSSPADQDYAGEYQVSDAVRKALHVGNSTFGDGKKVEEHLTNDIMDSVKPWLQELLDHYRVLLYSGQLDVIVGAPLTAHMITTFEWSGAKAWPDAEKRIWKVDPKDEEVAGYVRNVNQFYYVIVRNAGHMVPYDQPRAALNMVNNFISGNPNF
jgi:vitellogenic carboxypeptidase-like protein